MPVMDGLTCLRHLKEREQEVPILVATSFNDEIKRQESIEAGAADYINKTDLFDCLPELLDTHLKKRRNTCD